MYLLKHGKAPLTYLIRGSNIYYFDEKLGYERELKYTKNQRTCFVDEMKGEQRLEHIIFQNGTLFVPKNKQFYKNFYLYITLIETNFFMSGNLK